MAELNPALALGDHSGVGVHMCWRQLGFALAFRLVQETKLAISREGKGTPSSSSKEGTCWVLGREHAEGRRHVITGCHVPVGSSVHARCLNYLILRGTSSVFHPCIAILMESTARGGVLHGARQSARALGWRWDPLSLTSTSGSLRYPHGLLRFVEPGLMPIH